MSNTRTRLVRIAADQKMIDGVVKYLTVFASLPVGSQSMAPADIVKIIQERVRSAQAVVTAEAAFKDAVKADRDERVSTAKLMSSLRRIVLGFYGESPNTLAAFGLTAPRTGKKKVDVKAAAVAKGKATRKARNTMGRKQKAKVKGSVPATPPPPANA